MKKTLLILFLTSTIHNFIFAVPLQQYMPKLSSVLNTKSGATAFYSFGLSTIIGQFSILKTISLKDSANTLFATKFGELWEQNSSQISNNLKDPAVALLHSRSNFYKTIAMSCLGVSLVAFGYLLYKTITFSEERPKPEAI